MKAIEHENHILCNFEPHVLLHCNIKHKNKIGHFIEKIHNICEKSIPCNSL